MTTLKYGLLTMNLGAQSETRSPRLGIEAEPGHVQGKQEKEATHFRGTAMVRKTKGNLCISILRECSTICPAMILPLPYSFP